MQPPLEYAVSSQLLDWLKNQHIPSVQHIPTWRAAKENALQRINGITEHEQAMSAFKWGEGDHEHWKGYMYRGEDGLMVTSDEEWSEHCSLVGHSPMFWTPHRDLADKLYRRSGTLLTCQLKTGSVGWWLMMKHDSDVAQALLGVLQEFLMDLTATATPHSLFGPKDRKSFKRQLKRLQTPRDMTHDPVTYWSSKGAGRIRTGWPLDLIAVTLHTMRHLFGKTNGLLPQVLHAGDWYGGEPTAYDSAEIIVLDADIYTKLDYLVPLLPCSRPIGATLMAPITQEYQT